VAPASRIAIAETIIITVFGIALSPLQLSFKYMDEHRIVALLRKGRQSSIDPDGISSRVSTCSLHPRKCSPPGRLANRAKVAMLSVNARGHVDARGRGEIADGR
jgi:hypothetical protein